MGSSLRETGSNSIPVLFLCIILNPLSITAQDRKSPPPPPPPRQITQGQPDVPDSLKRRQAYTSFMEAQRLKGEAQRQRSARLLEEAITKLKETIQLDPGAAEPRIDLGEIYFLYLSRSNLAETEALEAVRLEPNNPNGHLLLARLYAAALKTDNNAASTNLDLTLKSYERVSELDPGRAEAWAMMANLYQVKNDVDKQIYALEKWTGAPLPSDGFFYRWLTGSELSSDQAYLQLSTLYLGKEKDDQAISAARTAFEMNPDSNENTRNLINILRSAATGDQELKIYSRLVKSSYSPVLLIGYGSALIRSGRYNEAAENLSEYVSLDPANASAIGLLAIAQRRSNQREAAIETLKMGITRVEAGTRIDLMLSLAETYEELGKDEEAIAQYVHAFDSILSKGELTPANAPLFDEVVNRLIKVYRRTGNKTGIAKITDRVGKVIDEQNSLLAMINIDSLREAGKLSEAQDTALAAGRRYPYDRSIKLTQALILSEMKLFGESIDLLKSIITKDLDQKNEDLTPWLIKSGVEMQSGDFAAAESSVRKALEIAPDSPDAYIQLSSVLDSAGKHQESEQILRDLVNRDPSNATVLNNLGYFLIEAGRNYEEALSLIERAVAVEPINGSYLDSLGWAYYKSGNKLKARYYLEKALIYSPRNSTIHEHLGDVLNDLGESPLARQQWEKALEYSNEDDVIARIKAKLK